MAQITPPQQSDYPPFYHTYVSKVGTTDLIQGLTEEHTQLHKAIDGLEEQAFDYRYAAGKWSIREVLIHMCDTERIFGYRALRFIRSDNTPLAGFEQEDYGARVLGTKRPVINIMKEFDGLRQSAIALYESLDESALSQKGTASGGEFTVRAKGYIILGHALHHRKIISEKYLSH